MISISPGAFPVGSPASRAAARAMLSRRLTDKPRMELIISCGVDHVSASEWNGDGDGTLGRVVSLPDNVSFYEAAKQLGGYTEAELAFLKADPRSNTLSDVEIFCFTRE